MTGPCPPEFVLLGEKLADAAGEVVMRYFRRPLGIDDKADESPVTEADRQAEATMRALIAEAAPDHGVIGEEHGENRRGADFVWVLDPIDGTKAFISGVPVFGILIALLYQGRPILGIIDQPVTRERWVGAAGRPTTLNGAPVKTAARGGVGDSVLWSTSPEMFDHDPKDKAAHQRLRAQVKFMHYGGECYQYAMLASGQIDLVLEADLQPYDFCALVPVIEGAGGIISDWRGAPLTLDSDGRVLASANRELHTATLAVLDG